jgi:hypothetical protein
MLFSCAKQIVETTELRNRIAELEEEKGNLQLQLLDTDELKSGAFFWLAEI